MKQEVDSFITLNVFESTDLLLSFKALDVWWMFVNKYNPNGSIIHGPEKAQLVVQGFSQRLEDYNLTYTSVTKMTSIWITIAYATFFDFNLFIFEVKTTFLNASLSHNIYCK